MKVLSIFILLVALVSCSDTSSIKTTSGVDVDSLIEQNMKNFEVVSEVNKKSDTVITTKIDETVQKIDKLETEIKELKEENNELKDKLDDAADAGRSFRIRAISDN